MKRLQQFCVGILTCIFTAAVTTSSYASSLRSASVGKPIAYENYVVFDSVDSKTLTCIDLQGTTIWERKYPSDIRYSRRDDSSVAVQAGMDISVVDVPTGSETPLFKTRTKNELVHFDLNGSIVYSLDDRGWWDCDFRMLDPKSGAVLWKKDNIGYVIRALEDMVICLTKPTPLVIGSDELEKLEANSSYEAIGAFDRKSGKRLWKIPSRDFDDTRLSVVHIQPHFLMLGSPTRLICLNVNEGQIISMIDAPQGEGNAFRGIGSKDGLVIYMRDHQYDTKSLHLCSVPDLKEQSMIELSQVEPQMDLSACQDNYIIASWSREAACLDATSGRRIWQKDFPVWSGPIDGKIYFRDKKDFIFRVGAIDIASGQETVLYEEKVSKPKSSKPPYTDADPNTHYYFMNFKPVGFEVSEYGFRPCLYEYGGGRWPIELHDLEFAPQKFPQFPFATNCLSMKYEEDRLVNLTLWTLGKRCATFDFSYDEKGRIAKRVHTEYECRKVGQGFDVWAGLLGDQQPAKVFRAELTYKYADDGLKMEVILSAREGESEGLMNPSWPEVWYPKKVGELIESWLFDKEGRVIQVDRARGDTFYQATYDDADRIVKEAIGWDNYLEYTYDDKGRLIRVVTKLRIGGSMHSYYQYPKGVDVRQIEREDRKKLNLSDETLIVGIDKQGRTEWLRIQQSADMPVITSGMKRNNEGQLLDFNLYMKVEDPPGIKKNASPVKGAKK